MNLHQLHRREENQDEYRSQYLSWIKTRYKIHRYQIYTHTLPINLPTSKIADHLDWNSATPKSSKAPTNPASHGSISTTSNIVISSPALPMAPSPPTTPLHPPRHSIPPADAHNTNPSSPSPNYTQTSKSPFHA